MNIFLGIAWFFSYLTVWVGFVYFGWLWSYEVQSAKATAFWLFMSVLLGAIGGYITLRIIEETPAG